MAQKERFLKIKLSPRYSPNL